jgi:hypothetical protein
LQHPTRSLLPLKKHNVSQHPASGPLLMARGWTHALPCARLRPCNAEHRSQAWRAPLHSGSEQGTVAHCLCLLSSTCLSWSAGSLVSASGHALAAASLSSFNPSARHTTRANGHSHAACRVFGTSHSSTDVTVLASVAMALLRTTVLLSKQHRTHNDNRTRSGDCGSDSKPSSGCSCASSQISNGSIAAPAQMLQALPVLPRCGLYPLMHSHDAMFAH